MKDSKIKLIFGIIMVFMLVFNACCFAVQLDDDSKQKMKSSGMKEKADFSNTLAEVVAALGDGYFSMVNSGAKKDNGDPVTFDDLVFDKYETTSIDFFKTDIKKDSATDMIKQSVTLWYGNFRKIALTAYLIILLYIGIRVLITVSGKQQEKYKEYLIAWGEGVLLLLFFPYILKFALDLNHAFVTMIGDSTLDAVNHNKPDDQKISSTSGFMSEMQQLGEQSIPGAIVWDIICFEFILILTTYYKRLFMVGFLIAVFPVVMILYPIDKVNDGRSQSFSVWLKEMMSNVFMQTFHALIFVFVIGVASNAKHNWILAFVAVTFLFKGEEILKQILGMGGSATAKNPGENAIKAMATVRAAQKITEGAVNIGSRVASGVRHSRLARSRGQRMFGSKSENHERAQEIFNARADMVEDDGSSTPRASGASLPAGDAGGGGTGLTPGSVTGADDKAADDISAGLSEDSKDKGKKRKLLNSTDRMLDRLENPDDEAMQKALERHGLTDNGKEAMRKLNSTRNQAMKALVALNPKGMTKDEYNKAVEKIKKDFQVGVSAAFKFQLPEANARTSEALFRSMLRKHGGRRDYGYKDGKRVRGQYKEYDLDSIQAKAKKKLGQLSKIADKSKIIRERSNIASNAVIDDSASMSEAQLAAAKAQVGRTQRRVFASTEENIKGVKKNGSAPVLVGQAAKDKQAILDKLDNSVYGQKQKEEIATALAMIRTFGASTRLGSSEYEANLTALKALKAQLDANAAAGITDPVDSNALQFFTAEQMAEAVETLKKYNINGMLDGLVKDGLGDMSLGSGVSDVDAVVTDMIDSFGFEEETDKEGTCGTFGDIDRSDMDEEALELRRKTQKRSQKIRQEANQKIEKKRNASTKISRTIQDKDGNDVSKQYDIDDLDDISTQQVLNMQNDMMKKVEGMDFVAAFGVSDPLEAAIKEWSGVILKERSDKLEQVGMDVLDRMESELNWINAPKVNGQTFEQFEAEGQMHRQKSAEDFARAYAQIKRIEIAAMTTGPMAIGLANGPILAEYTAGTAVGAKLLDGAGIFNRERQKTLKVRDDFGEVRTITIDDYSLSGLATDLVDSMDESKVYDISELRHNTELFSGGSGSAATGSMVNANNALLAQIESQLATFASAEQEKMYTEADKRRDAAARAKAGKFGSALGPRRRRP